MRNFILGVGAQKAGTTWIWELLQCKTFSPPMRKELHFLNNLPVEKKFINTHLDGTFFMRRAPFIPLEDPNSFQLCVRDYFKYFVRLSLSDELNATGEITPDYALLTRSKLKIIRQEMLDSNFAPKVFFIMRDPIARIISAFRMAVDRQRIDPNKYHSIDQAFQDYSFRPNVLAKSKYEFTISNLESAFNRTELFIGFHEDMKTQSGLNNLGNFLDLHFDDLVKINSFNSSNFEFTPSPHTLALLKKELSSTYDYIKHHFKDYRF